MEFIRLIDIKEEQKDTSNQSQIEDGKKSKKKKKGMWKPRPSY